MKQLPLPMHLPARDGFDALVVGRNDHAVAHLRGLLPGAGLAAPVYLWGDAGSGKTRLLRALAAQHQAQGDRVGWFDAGTALPWALDEAWSLVVVDRCEALDADHQQAAFALFVEAGTHGVQWAAAGRLPPVDLPVRDDLRTRLGWGHVFQLLVLSEAERRAVLRQAADARGVFLGDEVMDYMLNRFSRDLGSLMQLLDLLDHYALQTQRAITIPLIRSMLENA
jgi:DnaA family protein